MKIDLEIDPTEWQKQSVRWGHPAHSMCSYMASFPPKVPHYFIDRFTNKGDIVLDPFSGRGTTPAEACLMGRVGIGIDLNPIAYVLTKAKVNPPNRKKLLARIEYLESNFKSQDTSQIPEKIKMLYSDVTIQQLLFLKKELDYKKKNVDNFIMALILGGMHGDSGKPSYMSIPMPNTFSMSPNYVRNFIDKHNLKPPKHNVFEVVKHRLKRAYNENMPKVKGKAYLDDFRNIPKIFNKNRYKADLIFTSPPYLKVIKYGKMNWIRLWMFDDDPKEIDMKLDAGHTVPTYMEFMTETLNKFEIVMKEDALCFMVVGQVNGNRGPGTGKGMRLGNQIRHKLKDKTNLHFVNLIDDKYNKYLRVQKNVSRIWGKTQGRATRYDQILVLCKDPELINKKKYKKQVNWERLNVNSQITLEM